MRSLSGESSFLKNNSLPYALLPIIVLLFIILGWYAVRRQTQALIETNITAYQQTELEIVRAAARSVEGYVFEQTEDHNRLDVTELEQEVFTRFIIPIHLLENGDAWIYAPDHMIFDLSADFSDEYRSKSMAAIFKLQENNGASHFEEMVAAVTEAREGVDWYIWLPEKGREIAAWTPVQVGEYIWTIGLSTPLSEILESTGAAKQIYTLNTNMAAGTVVILGLLLVWGIGEVRRKQTEDELRISEDALETERAQLLSIFDSIDEIVYVADPQTYEVLYVNQAMQNAFQKELIGGICYQEFQGLAAPCAFCTNEIILKQKPAPYRWEYYNPTIDRHYAIVDRIIEWPDGRDVRFELALDFTERVRAKQALQKAHDELEVRVEKRTVELAKINESLRVEIAERIQAEETLQQERDFAEGLVDTAQIIILVLDVEGRIVRFNPYMETLSGYTLAEIQGQDWFSTLLPVQDHSKIRTLFQKAIGDIHTKGNVNPIVTKDGQERQIEWYDKTLKNADGSITGLLAVGLDITERQQAAEGLSEKTIYLDNILRSATEYAIITTDLDFRITYYNPLAQQIFGYSGEEVIGKTVQKMHMLERVASERFEKAVENVRTHREHRYQSVREDASGTRYRDLRMSGIYDSADKLVGFALFTHDVTERVQAEEALRTSESRASALLEAIPDMMFRLDSQGVFLDYRVAQADLYSQAADTLIGKKNRDFVSPEFADLIEQKISQTLVLGEMQTFEYQLPIHGRGLVDYEARMVKNGANEVTAIVRDVTERVRAEEQIRAALVEKEVLLREIHHRVKNNLQLISSLLNLQADTIAAPEVRAAFQESESRIQAIGHIHEQLYGSGNLAQIEMHPYVRGLTNYLRQLHGRAGIVQEIDIADDIVLAIQQALPCGQIINELISNAFEHAFPLDGYGIIRIAIYANNEQTELIVSDNGIGLPRDMDLENHKTLGLRLVDMFTRQLKGTLTLSGDKGVTFKITF